jgi:trehalose synthase
MKRFDSSSDQPELSQTGRKVVSKDDKEVSTSSRAWTDPATHQVGLLNRLVSVEDYEPFIGPEVVERILSKARALQGFKVVNFNSTFYGGGVAELLSAMTLLMNSLGIKAEWRVIQGRPDFFNITKKMHNALQGADINLSEIKTTIFEEVNFENAVRNRIDHDMVVVHDPQPLPLIDHFPKKCPWLWRCHIELSNPDCPTWKYLTGFIEKYDAVILSHGDYQQNLPIPQLIFMPAINPFSIKNKELTTAEMDDRLDQYKIPVDLPLIVQVSRFDRWKDPAGVVEAFKLAQKEIDATLVLLGNFATDDPEGARVYEHLASIREERILVLPNGDDTALVNTLQRRAAVVLQKSLREGFGLTVTEAMWKGTPVIGGNVGGIRSQIQDGVNGFLVSSVKDAADRIVQLLKDARLREQMGRKARQAVTERFLLTRYLEQYLGLFGAFETIFRLPDSWHGKPEL